MRYIEIEDTITNQEAADLLGLASKSSVIHRIDLYNQRNKYGERHRDRLVSPLRRDEIELIRDCPGPGRQVDPSSIRQQKLKKRLI